MILDFDVLIQQMVAFYTIMMVGFLAYHLKLLQDEDISSLTSLIVRLLIPLMLLTCILNSTNDLGAFLPVFCGLALAQALMLGLGYASGRLFHLKNPTLGVHTAVVGFQNDGFIGDPLWLAVFPNRAGLAILAGSILFSITQWTVSYSLTAVRGNGYHFQLKKIVTPPLVSVIISLILLLVKVHPSGHIWDTLTGIGNCTKYLAMLYIGASLAQKGFKRLLTRPVLFAMTFVKMLAGPILVFLFLRLLHIVDGTWLVMIVMMMSVPAPVMVCMQAAMNHSDEDYAIGGMVLTTLVSLGTLPLVMYLVGLLSR